MSKRRLLSPGSSRWPPRFHDTASQQPRHPLQLPHLPLRPRHTCLYHPLHQLAWHRDILVSSSRRLALLPLRPPLVAASCYHGSWCSAAAKQRMRAHGKGKGVHRRQIVAAPDTRALQQAWGDARGHPLCLPIGMPEAQYIAPGVEGAFLCHRCRVHVPTGNRDDVGVAKVLRLNARWHQVVVVVAECTVAWPPLPNVQRAPSFVTTREWKSPQATVSTGDPPNATSTPNSVGTSLLASTPRPSWP